MKDGNARKYVMDNLNLCQDSELTNFLNDEIRKGLLSKEDVKEKPFYSEVKYISNDINFNSNTFDNNIFWTKVLRTV